MKSTVKEILWQGMAAASRSVEKPWEEPALQERMWTEQGSRELREQTAIGWLREVEKVKEEELGPGTWEGGQSLVSQFWYLLNLLIALLIYNSHVKQFIHFSVQFDGF
jgi:hypothetical protein